MNTQSYLLAFLFIFAPKVYGQAVGTERSVLPGEQKITGPWQMNFETEASKSMAEYTDWNGSVSADVAYKYKDFDLGAGIAYLYPFDDTVTVTEERNYGPDDLELSARYKDLLPSSIRSLRPSAALTLPTSTISQKATMYASGSLGVSFVQNDYYFNWGTSHSLVLSAYQYETANALGTTYNSPYGVNNSFRIYRSFNKVTLTTSYSIYTYYNYANNTKNLQTARTSIAWAFQKDWSATAYYRWRDTMVSNLSAFNDDTSKAGLYLTYSM